MRKQSSMTFRSPALEGAPNSDGTPTAPRQLHYCFQRRANASKIGYKHEHIVSESDSFFVFVNVRRSPFRRAIILMKSISRSHGVWTLRQFCRIWKGIQIVSESFGSRIHSLITVLHRERRRCAATRIELERFHDSSQRKTLMLTQTGELWPRLRSNDVVSAVVLVKSNLSSRIFRPRGFFDPRRTSADKQGEFEMSEERALFEAATGRNR